MSDEQNPFEQCAKLAERHAEQATDDCSEAGFAAAHRLERLAQEIRELGGIAPEPKPLGPSLRDRQQMEQMRGYESIGHVGRVYAITHGDGPTELLERDPVGGWRVPSIPPGSGFWDRLTKEPPK